MTADGIGFMPVMEEDRLLGVVIDRDIVCRGLAEDFESNNAAAKEVMTKTVITGYPEMKAE